MKIEKGWKLFEMRDDGKLFPLFIGKNTETPMNEWVPAEIIMDHKGFSHRPGWHLGTQLPSAPWLMSADGTYKSQRGKRFKRVWCEVEYVADIDYTEIVNDNLRSFPCEAIGIDRRESDNINFTNILKF